MLEQSSNFAEVRFLDLEKVISDLRSAASQVKASHPEVAKVFLFGSLTDGTWTADSDADLIVVVRKLFPDILARSQYQIHVASIATDTLVYSQEEFDRLRLDPGSFLSQICRPPWSWVNAPRSCSPASVNPPISTSSNWLATLCRASSTLT